MRATNTTESWGWVTRAFHWLLAVLILYQLFIGVYMMNFVDDLLAQFELIQTHKSWGAVIFTLVLARLIWRLFNRQTPVLPSRMPAWQVHASHVSHAMLYILMLVMPISGWVLSSASPTQDLLNIQNMVFDWFAMPDPWVPGVASVETAGKVVHTGGAILLVLLLIVHVAAALKHQLVDRDGVLARMSWGR